MQIDKNLMHHRAVHFNELNDQPSHINEQIKYEN
jgi:hypothetical protein